MLPDRSRRVRVRRSNRLLPAERAVASRVGHPQRTCTVQTLLDAGCPAVRAVRAQAAMTLYDLAGTQRVAPDAPMEIDWREVETSVGLKLP